MFVPASRSTAKGRALQSRLSGRTKVLSPGHIGIAASASLQQRGFRFGPWRSSDFDDDLHKEARRRHRHFRYRYMESISRRISWGNHLPVDITRAAIRKALGTAAQSTFGFGADAKGIWSNDTSTSGSARDSDIPRKASQSKEPRSGEQADNANDVWTSPLNNIRDYLNTQRSPSDISTTEGMGVTNLSELNEIDPITNRRIPKTIKPEENTSIPFTPKFEDVDSHGAGRPDKQNLVDLCQRPAEAESKVYEDLDKYAPKIDDPIAPRTLHSEEESKNYGDLDKYANVEWGEPDDLSKLTREEKSKLRDELRKYNQVELDELDGLQNSTPEETAKTYEDLDSYGQVRWNEPDGSSKQVSEDPIQAQNDLDKYGPVWWNEPYGQKKLSHEEESKNYTDLDQYDGSQTLTPKETSKQDSDLSSSDSFTERYKATAKAYDSPTNYPDELGESLTAQDIRNRVLRRARENSQKQMLEEDKARHDTAWDVITESAQETLKQTNPAPTGKLTGNYARDFPEEFTTSWSTAHSSAPDTLLPKDQVNTITDTAASESVTAANEEVEFGSMDESFPSESTRLEPALKRHMEKLSPGKTLSHLEKIQAAKDPYSKTPQGLETSFVEELDEEPTSPAVTKHYSPDGTKGPPKETLPPEEDIAKVEKTAESPLSYKVLALDPATQSIRIAETSSTVLDGSPPLSPADVLLRLSSPAKFFPHFSSLRAQGYEMISGKEDLLVFRKTRASSSASRPPEAERYRIYDTPVNPVDMMGKPMTVTGNFASPTGFVNYDTLPDQMAQKPEPPFRSNIDVRREEPVFSGVKGERQGRRKKRRWGRKLFIGTTGLVGTAYAMGVLGQYFSSGGAA